MSEDRDRFLRVKDILVGAGELPPGKRAAYLDAACEGDPDLRREVESLLDHETDRPAVLDSTEGARRLNRAVAENLLEDHPGSIGPYRILDVLGAGGMGVVYLAEQTEPLRRTVALKLIKRGMDTDRVIARFESERQTLALMDHPNIARVLDAGADASGRPYFVMERVEGDPLNVYCDAHRLDTRARLGLFLTVCRGVQHAHQKGIIHRDLKPTNVLVAERDEAPEVKIIDFGIAKAVEPGEDASMLTREGQFIGTPEYMSPEQARGRPVDVRTDVYALGVLLYELLVGELPFRRNDDDVTELLRRIREEDPQRPSTRVATREANAAQRALARGTQPGALRRELRGDVDWILLKALDRDLSQRYGSAAELAADIGRYLAHEPVLAGPPGTRYRMGKFVRRHRSAVAATALVAVALVAGIAGTTWQAVRATREAQRSERMLDELRDFANQFIFGVHDEVGTLANATPVREYIVREAARYLDGLSENPRDAERLWEPLAAAYTRLGKAQRELGQTEASRISYERSFEILDETLRRDPGALRPRELKADANISIAALEKLAGDTGASLERTREAIAIFESLCETAPDSTGYADGLARAQEAAGFTLVRMGRSDEAVDLYRSAVAVREGRVASHPDDDTAWLNLATAQAFLGEAISEMDDQEAALAAFEQSTRTFAEGYRRNPNNTLFLNRLAVTTGALGVQYDMMGRYQDAVRTLRRALALRRDLHRKNPENVRSTRDLAKGHNQLGNALMNVGDPEAARIEFLAGIAILEPVIAQDPNDAHARRYLVSLSQSLAQVYVETGQPGDALAVLKRADGINNALLKADPERDDHHLHRAEGYHLVGLANARAARQAASFDESARLWKSARESQIRSLDVLLAMRESGILGPSRMDLFEERRREIAECDSALTALGSTP